MHIDATEPRFPRFYMVLLKMADLFAGKQWFDQTE
jgi:hypothetical protein